MAAGPRKSTARHKPAAPTQGHAVGRTGRLAAKRTTKRQNKASTPAKAWEKTAIRKPARQQTPPRRAASGSLRTSNADAVLAARLEAISKDLEALAGLRDEIHELRTSIEMLTDRVDSLLKANDEHTADRSEESEPAIVPEGHSETKVLESDNAWDIGEQRSGHGSDPLAGTDN
jgi:hypothetical protein